MERRIACALASMALLTACGGSSQSGGDGDAGDASGSYGTVEAGGPQAVVVSGAVVELTSSSTNPVVPLAGVTVCVVAHAGVPCTTSDATGAFSFPHVAPDTDVAFSFTKTGYYGLVLLAHAPATALRLPTAKLSTDAEEGAFFQAAGWSYPAAGQGVLRVHAQSTGQTSCDGLDQLTLATSTSAIPVYERPCADTSSTGGPDPTLAATTTSGEVDFLVAAGPVDATATSSTLLCTVSPFPGWGWASTQLNSLGAVVVADHETLVALQCKP